MKHGIKETKELLKFVIEIAEALDASLADGDIGFMDLSNLVSAMMASAAAFDNISMIPAEMKDLDTTEAQELYDYCKSELDLASDKIESIVEMALQIGLKVYELTQLVHPKDPTPAPTGMSATGMAKATVIS